MLLLPGLRCGGCGTLVAKHSQELLKQRTATSTGTIAEELASRTRRAASSNVRTPPCPLLRSAVCATSRSGSAAPWSASRGVAPVSLAAAFAVTRPFVRLRLPAELAVAAVIARLCEPLRQIDIGPLIGLRPGGDSKTWSSQWLPQWAARWATASPTRIVRQYGAAYYVGSELVGVVSLVAVAVAASRFGVDEWVDASVAGADLGDMAAAWAAGALAAAVLSPLYLFTLPDAIVALLRVRHRVRVWAARRLN
eukprot:TRINITY_DN4801_c0_g1_i1.p1 TRINITY_DN4801_c0_g1~~TRINITY_DN4801_c0_g1_i1.p1  ORF type:complete len:252 (+),score=22.20 TRINITY_DN4801_c0_g1_i1:91-846(+)